MKLSEETKDYLNITIKHSDIDITEKKSLGWDKLITDERRMFNEAKKQIIKNCCVEKYDNPYYANMISIKLDYIYSKITESYRDKLIKEANEMYNMHDDKTNYILLESDEGISMFLSDSIAYNI